MQIALGGWTSTNYAAAACPDFPTCQGSFWPPMDFGNGYKLWRGLGIDYEGGVLDGPARTAIHYTHRLGAYVTAFVLALVVVSAWRRGQSGGARVAAVAVAIAVPLQIAIGMNLDLERLAALARHCAQRRCGATGAHDRGRCCGR